MQRLGGVRWLGPVASAGRALRPAALRCGCLHRATSALGHLRLSSSSSSSAAGPALPPPPQQHSGSGGLTVDADQHGVTSDSEWAAWLSDIGNGDLQIYAGQLAQLGIQERDDLQYVREEELREAGIPLVAARRMMAHALPQVRETSMMMRPQPTLNAAAEAGLKRGTRHSGVIFVSSALGGALLSFGGAMYVMVGGGTVRARQCITPVLVALASSLRWQLLGGIRAAPRPNLYS
jgi:hypothetical protein